MFLREQRNRTPWDDPITLSTPYNLHHIVVNIWSTLLSPSLLHKMHQWGETHTKGNLLDHITCIKPPVSQSKPKRLLSVELLLQICPKGWMESWISSFASINLPLLASTLYYNAIYTHILIPVTLQRSPPSEFHSDFLTRNPNYMEWYSTQPSPW